MRTKNSRDINITLKKKQGIANEIKISVRVKVLIGIRRKNSKKMFRNSNFDKTLGETFRDFFMVSFSWHYCRCASCGSFVTFREFHINSNAFSSRDCSEYILIRLKSIHSSAMFMNHFSISTLRSMFICGK